MITFTELLERAKTEEIAIHTPTEEQAIILLKALDERGYEWNSEKTLTTRTNYEDFREFTCYNFQLNNKIMYGSLKFHQEHDCTIIKFKDIDFEENA